MIWGARLSGFLLFRIIKTGKDDRFDDKRDKFFSFLGFWVFQMIWVWTVSLPVTILNSPNVTKHNQPKFGTGRDIAGVILFAIGFLMYRSTFSGASRRTRARSAMWDSLCGRDILITLERSSFNSVSYSYSHFGPSTNIISHLYDCSLTSRLRICPWRSIQRIIRLHPRRIFPHSPPHVRLGSPTSRTAWSEEAL